MLRIAALDISVNRSASRYLHDGLFLRRIGVTDISTAAVQGVHWNYYSLLIFQFNATFLVWVILGSLARSIGRTLTGTAKCGQSRA